jgi:hypothetical protein
MQPIQKLENLSNDEFFNYFMKVFKDAEVLIKLREFDCDALVRVMNFHLEEKC